MTKFSKKVCGLAAQSRCNGFGDEGIQSGRSRRDQITPPNTVETTKSDTSTPMSPRGHADGWNISGPST
ncbi:MAG: hypothetical protein JSW66_16555 [Phycisphaerales bacterium]|nr:MAG: hypothetical protein JSW66_16555 [Phycisphaerales bacterium]